MNLNGKKMLVFTVTVILVAVWIWPRKALKIAQVEDGNTVVLNNGATVKLFGVSSTIQGKDELEQLKGKKVDIVPDQDKPFEMSQLDRSSMVYAYVLLPDFNYECINATLLKQGKASLLENCTDSIRAFRRYASKGGVVVPSPPIPTPPPVIDYSGDEIKLPDYVSPNGRVHSHWYTDGNQNINMIKEACDFDLPYTRNFAVQLAGRSQGFKQIFEIFDYCYNRWHYVNDPAGQEYVARASESIHNNLSGDCDDYAVLMASCMLAIGFEPSIITAYRGDGIGHAYAEVCISQFNENDILKDVKSRFPQYTINSLHTSVHDGRKWLNLDWQAGYPGGPYWSSSNKGTYVYSSSSNNWHWNGYVGEYYGISSSQNVTVYDVNGNWYATGLLVESAAKASLRIDNSNYELTSSDKDIFRYMVKGKRLYVK